MMLETCSLTGGDTPSPSSQARAAFGPAVVVAAGEFPVGHVRAGARRARPRTGSAPSSRPMARGGFAALARCGTSRAPRYPPASRLADVVGRLLYDVAPRPPLLSTVRNAMSKKKSKVKTKKIILRTGEALVEGGARPGRLPSPRW